MRAGLLAALFSLLVVGVVAGCGKSGSMPPPVTPVRPPAADAGRVDPYRPPEMMIPPKRDAAVADAPPAPTMPPPGVDADEEEDVAPTRPPPPPVMRTPNVFWKPSVGATWDWQLKVPIDPTVNVDVYDIDMFENDAHVVHDLHMRGKKVICYVNMGAWENWRPDAHTVPPHLRGTQYHGFPDENWLDIRDIVGLTPFVHSRLNRARDMGCDAVEPDNMDGYDTMAHESTGFPLTPIHQIVYNRYVASQAHARGMAVGLKNNTAQVEELVGDFDFHVSEQCFEHMECDKLMPFINAGKPVFEAEYVLPTSAFCADAKTRRISAIKKMVALDAWREVCP
jgi:hypothetical protein